jgi:hypothetical protein
VHIDANGEEKLDISERFINRNIYDADKFTKEGVIKQLWELTLRYYI